MYFFLKTLDFLRYISLFFIFELKINRLRMAALLRRLKKMCVYILIEIFSSPRKKERKIWREILFPNSFTRQFFWEFLDWSDSFSISRWVELGRGKAKHSVWLNSAAVNISLVKVHQNQRPRNKEVLKIF